MKRKLFFLTLFIGALLNTSASVTDSAKRTLQEMINDTISFASSSQYIDASPHDIHYAIPDTTWIKRIKDKSKVVENKHYYLRQVEVAKENIIGKQFYVMNVEVGKGKYDMECMRVYLIDIESKTPIIWSYGGYESGFLMVVSKRLNSNQFNPNEELYYYINNYRYSKDDHRGYVKVKCVDCLSYYDGENLSKKTRMTLVADSGKQYTCSDKNLVITKGDYEYRKRQTIQKLKSEGEYTFALSKIEKPKNPTIRYGKFQEVKTEDVISKYLYEDNVISILWYGTKEEFVFLLKNKSENSLKIVWDEASFINEENGACRIAHKGVSKARLNEMQPPTVVPKGTELNDMIVPVDRIDDFLIDLIWKHDPKRDGKNVKILLPVEIKGVINEYIFTFDLVWKYKYPELQ